MAATQTTYIDANGEKKTGYIINGTTYTDAEGKNAVGIGSIVNTKEGQYIKTDNGSMLYSDYLKNNGIHPVNTELDGVGGTGYIKDGATYTDALLKNRVGSGTVVTAVDGTRYIKTDDGSMLYSDYLKQQEENAKKESLKRQEEEIERAYSAAIAANDAKAAAEMERQRARIQEQIAQLNQSYSDLNKQLYRDYMFNRRDLPQELAAQGITGGMAESSRIGLASDYESGLSANERGRLNDITSLERGGNDAEMQLRIEKLRADADDADKRYERLAAALAAQQDQDNFERQLAISEAQRQRENELKERQWAHDSGEEAAERARAEIDAYLAAGGSVAELPKELLEAAGYSGSYLSAMANYYAGEKQKNDDEATYAKELEKAQIAAKLGDTSLLYELLGIEQPTSVYSTELNSNPNPNPNPNPSKTTPTTSPETITGITNVTRTLFRNFDAESGLKYLLSRVEKGYITDSEANDIAEQLGLF